MPKELKELSGFNGGTISAPSESDIPDSSATYSLNLDAVTEGGKLKGIADDIKLKEGGQGVKKVVANYSTYPSGDSAGTSVLFVADDKVQLKITSGNYSATTDEVTYTTNNNNTWQLILSQLVTTGTISFANTTTIASGGSANLITEGEEFTAIKPAFSNIISSIIPRAPHVEYNVSDEIVSGEHGIATSGSTQEVIGLMIQGVSSSDELTIEIIKTNAANLDVFEKDAQGNDFTEFLNIAANEMQFLKDKAKDNLFFYDKADGNKIKILEDFYGSRTIIDGYMAETATGGSQDQEEAYFNLPESDDVSMENYNNAMYIGPGSNNKSKWMGYIENVQMGQANKGFYLENSELSPLDGVEGSASVDRIIEFGNADDANGTDDSTFESGHVNNKYWLGINKTTYNLYTINKAEGATAKSGKIIGSTDTLPIRPSIIAPCKRSTTSSVYHNNVWIANEDSHNVYRLENITIAADGKATWTNFQKFTATFHSDTTIIDNAVLIDIMETYDNTATNGKAYLWGLFGYPTASNEKIGPGKPFIYSARIKDTSGTTPGLISTDAGNDGSFAWHDRTPASKVLTAKNGTSFYDDSNLIDWGNANSYISNQGLNERQVWRYYYKKPTTAHEAFWTRTNAVWGTPEHGYSIVKNIYDTNLDTVEVKPYNQTNTSCGDDFEPGSDELLPSKYGGWEEGLEIQPYRLIELPQSNFDTTYNSTVYKSHCVGAFANVKGTMMIEQGRLGYVHYSSWSCYAHDYKFYNTVARSTHNINGLSLITTSTNHFGVKHFYKSHDGSTTTNFGPGGDDPADIGVRNSCLNADNKVGIFQQGTDSSGTTLDPFNNLSEVFDIKKTTGNSNAMVSFKGESPTKAYITCFDLSIADGMNSVGVDGNGIGYKDSSNFPKIITSESSDRDLQASVLAHLNVSNSVSKLLISPTAGQYENGLIQYTPSTGAMGANVYTLNDNSVEDFGIGITEGEADANGSFKQSTTYYYKASLLYDDFQESPLTLAADSITMANTCKSLNVKINTKRPLSRRATHIIVYRKNGPDEFYKMVKEVKLSSNWQAKSGGMGFSKSITDDGGVGATYEAITGMPETLRETSVDYKLSTQADGCLFVANCSHPQIENGDHFIFKSQPGNLSVFNWAQDYLIMPQVPTAIKSYAGKLYVWDTANMYRVNTMTLQIEDTFEGMGCIGENSVIATDRGMFFCDETNMYMHNGSSVTPIGDPILTSSGGDISHTAWQDIIHSTPPSVTYNAKNGSVYFLFNHNNTSYRAWVYNVRLRRWDLVDCPKPLSTILGPKNEVLVSDGSNLWNLNSSAKGKKWSFHSKDMSMGIHTQEKGLKKIKIEADDITKLNGVVWLEVDDSNAGFDQDYSKSKDTAYIAKPNTKASKTFKKVKIKFERVETEVDSIGIIYSKKGVK